MTGDAPRPRWLRMAPLLLLFLLALFPRVNGLSDYLPDGFHPDEDKEIRRAIKLGQRELDFDRYHKGFLFPILTVEYGAYYLLLRATRDDISSTDDFGLFIAGDPSMLFFLSRLTVAILGTLSVVLAYLITRRLAGPAAGWLAAVLLALLAPHLELSRYGRLDVPLTFCVLLVAYLALRAGARPRTRDIVALVIASGLTVCAKTSGAPFLLLALPPLFAWLGAAPDAGRRAARLGGAFVLASAIVAAFNIALFSFVFTAGRSARKPAAWESILETQYTGQTPSLFDNYIVAPTFHLGLLSLLAFVGVSFLVRRGGRARAFAALMVVAGVLQVLLLLVIPDLASWRYVLPSEALVVILGAVGFRYLARVAGRKGAPFMVALALLLLGYHGYHGYETYRIQRLEPAPVAARRWIEANLPQGSNIILEGDTVYPSEYMPRVRQTRASYLEKIERVEIKDPDKAQTLRKYFLPHHDATGFNVELYLFGRDADRDEEWDNDVEWLREQQPDYVVLHEIDAPEGRDYKRMYDACRDYCEKHGRLIGPQDGATTDGPSFDADNVHLRGRDIWIYKLSP